MKKPGIKKPKLKKVASGKSMNVTVVLKKEKKKESKAEMRREKMEDKREMEMQKALIAALKAKRK